MISSFEKVSDSSNWLSALWGKYPKCWFLIRCRNNLKLGFEFLLLEQNNFGIFPKGIKIFNNNWNLKPSRIEKATTSTYRKTYQLEKSADVKQVNQLNRRKCFQRRNLLQHNPTSMKIIPIQKFNNAAFQNFQYQDFSYVKWMLLCMKTFK